jgi:anhydro-N-acetylmuramic acid kinase
MPAHPLQRLWEKESRIVAGLMSGTSLDGVDAAIARMEGSGRGLKLEQLAFVSVPYSEEVRRVLLFNSAPESSDVKELSQLNFRITREYASALQKAAEAAGIALNEIDLIGSHGQTVHHVPEAEECAGEPTISTLQIGDPSVLANLVRIPVVGDFRVADMALGGQGAPLVPYFDYAVFSDEHETRGLLNLGGIGNMTVLPKSGDISDVFAFDTGPANMVIDQLTTRFYGEKYDEDGRHASNGRVLNELLDLLMEDAYFVQPPPKSTGRERYGATFVDAFVERDKAIRNPSISPDDLIATAAALTARSVFDSYERFIRARHTLDVLIVSGGGMHNPFLMRKLAEFFDPVPVRTVEDYGVNSDAKEALCFAVLAHEAVNGVPTSMPSVTGASRATLLGKICIPL